MATCATVAAAKKSKAQKKVAPAKTKAPAKAPAKAKARAPEKAAAKAQAPVKAKASKKVAKKAPTKPSPAKATKSAVAARRDDYGAPIEVALAKHAPPMRAIYDALQKLVREAAPDAEGALKWGMPVFTIGGVMMCALGGGKAHVNLVLPGPPGTYADPQGLLGGEGKTGKHLRIERAQDLPRAVVRTWLEKAAQLARAK